MITQAILLSSIIFCTGMGFLYGKYYERIKWNELIKEKIILIREEVISHYKSNGGQR